MRNKPRVNVAATNNATELLTSDETLRTASIARLMDLVKSRQAFMVNDKIHRLFSPPCNVACELSFRAGDQNERRWCKL